MITDLSISLPEALKKHYHIASGLRTHDATLHSVTSLFYEGHYCPLRPAAAVQYLRLRSFTSPT